MKTYYHIANVESKQSVTEKGLIAGADGYVYLLQGNKNLIEELIAKYVALFQLGIENYSLFKVSEKGFNTDIEADNVGELFASFQFRVKQSIDKKYIKFISNQTTNYKECCNIQMYMYQMKKR